MAGHARYTALLDACVLYPAVLRDALLSLRKHGFFAAKWSPEIEHEWTSNLLVKRPDIDPAALEITCEAMRRTAPDWDVGDYSAILPGLPALPDEGDRHVLAAAIRGHVDCIVTLNLKDFPSEIMEPLGIAVHHPDDFLVLQIDLREVESIAVFKAMRARLRSPPYDAAQFVQHLAKAGLPRTADRLWEAADLL